MANLCRAWKKVSQSFDKVDINQWMNADEKQKSKNKNTDVMIADIFQKPRTKEQW